MARFAGSQLVRKGLILCLLVLSAYKPALSQPPTSGAELTSLESAEVERLANSTGNAARGAILFHSPQLACGRCHSVSASGPDLLGPNLTQPLKRAGFEHLWESVIEPSKVVDQQYQALQVLTVDGDALTGLLVKRGANTLTLRTPDTLQTIAIATDDIEAEKSTSTSLMPTGLLASLANQQEVADLMRYVVEIQSGGPKRARELQPTAAQLAIQLPEYESNLDHAGMISDLDDEAFERGRAIYNSLCVNCHGTRQKPGSLATALRFGEGKFKYGDDPFSIYQTLTRGGGLMLPQPWMVPQQKYDVIHFIRRHFLADQVRAPTDDYLTALPKGTDRGPEPQEFKPWSQADYGPRLIATYEIGRGGRNIAQKGIAVQLDQSPGGIAQGKAWAIFDHDTMRLAGVWTSGGFIDWQGINFNGRHGIHPHVAGDILLNNPTGPGWIEPSAAMAASDAPLRAHANQALLDGLADDQRVEGRDGRRYGPLPRSWAQYRGFRQSGRDTLIDYTVGETAVTEAYAWLGATANIGGTTQSSGASNTQQTTFVRHLTVAPHAEPMYAVAATLEEGSSWSLAEGRAYSPVEQETSSAAHVFDGNHYFEADLPSDFSSSEEDFTLVVEGEFESDGTLCAIAPAEGEWAPGGQSFFIRGGRIVFDVGWVGAVTGPRIVDGKPHTIMLAYRSESGVAEIWVDGKLRASKELEPEDALEDRVFRIGKTSEDFPDTSQLEEGIISVVAVYDSYLPEGPLPKTLAARTPVRGWNLVAGTAVGNHPLKKIQHKSPADPAVQLGVTGGNARFLRVDERLLVKIPPNQDRSTISIWTTSADNVAGAQILDELAASSVPPSDQYFTEFTAPIKVPLPPSEDTGEGFAIESLAVPKQNPWLARVRLTGLDFYRDADRMAVCTWDGDVWEISGLSTSQETGELSWRRIAFGLFQPLGLRIIDETIYLTCRDQLVRLDDRNGDGLIDYYHCINNDHQVTEHFHEFAMGLQTDDEGNFYYAKSARHALPAVVPHHGTLLKVSKDGETTEILANGFRAANGVCLNPDGSFIVTDQEGHWNPKNRINWVQRGGFYGNMYGYHNVTDSSDAAMDAPLCWITNAFDRSPAELLWCDSPTWGPLQGSLLNLSYGYGAIYIVPHEKLADGRIQGGMCKLPIPNRPTGLIRGRFSPHDSHLYVCGLSAWATSQTSEEGGLYRIRYTAQPAGLPIGLSAKNDRLRIRLSEPAAADTDLSPSNFAVRVWSLKRTKNYGSKHYDERELTVASASLDDDGQLLQLHVPQLDPTWCMEITYTITTTEGKSLTRVIHNTIHAN